MWRESSSIRYQQTKDEIDLPLIIFALLFSLPPSRNSDPGAHSRLFSPFPTKVRAVHFRREKISALSSLVDSRRTVLTHARRSQQLLILFDFLEMISKSHHGGIRTHGPTPLIVLVVAFQGYHLTTGATGLCVRFLCSIPRTRYIGRSYSFSVGMNT